jgi:hypothetical protein
VAVLPQVVAEETNGVVLAGACAAALLGMAAIAASWRVDPLSKNVERWRKTVGAMWLATLFCGIGTAIFNIVRPDRGNFWVMFLLSAYLASTKFSTGYATRAARAVRRARAGELGPEVAAWVSSGRPARESCTASG